MSASPRLAMATMRALVLMSSVSTSPCATFPAPCLDPVTSWSASMPAA